jgi:hypothetical protein
MKAPVFVLGIMGTETLVLVVGPRPVAQDQRLAPDCKPVCGSKTFMPDRLISDWRSLGDATSTTTFPRKTLVGQGLSLSINLSINRCR